MSNPERRAARETALQNWIDADASRDVYASTFEELDSLVDEMNADARQDFWYDRVTSAQLLDAAQRLYRLAKERGKPDMEREPGYQDRDITFFTQRMQIIERRFDPAVDKAEWLMFLDTYLAQPAEQLGFPPNPARGQG